MGRKLLFVALLGGIIFSFSPARAASPDPKKLEEFDRLEQQLTDLFSRRQYEKAADLCRQQMKILPESAEPHYNLACAMTRMGKKDSALSELDRAVHLGFTDAAHMREDDDLAALRDEDQFKTLLKTTRQKELDAPHEASFDIDGMKTVEGFPEGGLRFRVRMGASATKLHPARLIIWLHPAGISMDDVVERLAPKFARDGFALAVFTQKNFNFWSQEDSQALIEHTLPEIGKIEGIDANKPVLMGYNVGGQAALQLWRENPGNFGGLILDAAYPIDAEKYASGLIEPFELPHNAGVRSCPIFALVGSEDGGIQLWEKADAPWRVAKVPLTLHVIPEQGPEWLFSASQIWSLSDWLKRIAAGELPSEEAPLAPHELQPDEREALPMKVLWPFSDPLLPGPNPS